MSKIVRSDLEVPLRDDVDDPEHIINRFLDRIVDVDVFCTNYEDGVATVLSSEPIEIENSERTADVRGIQELTECQKQILRDIVDRWGAGYNSDTWTNKDVVDETDTTDSYETVKKATRKFQEMGLATPVESERPEKVRRLTEDVF